MNKSSRSAQSIFYFSLYLLLTGPLLIFIPDTLLMIFQMAPTDDVWIRIVGMITFLLGIYYMHSARHELRPIFEISVYVRCSVLLFFIAFTFLEYAPYTLILFGLVDFIGAIWTYFALKSDKESILV